MDIVGYAFEDDYYCIDCTRNRFSDAELQSDALRDSQNNPVHPIFSTDEGVLDEHCGVCKIALMSS